MSKKRNTRQVAPFANIRDMLAQAEMVAGDKIAYKYRSPDGTAMEKTFAGFRKDTLCIGTALWELGLADSHIACCGENSYDWICVYLAALQSAGVFCPVDKDLPDTDFINVINGGKSSIVFCDKKREDVFRRLRQQLPSIKYFVCFDREEDDGEFLSFEKFKEKGKTLYDSGNREFFKKASAKEELKMLIYTSGTTGLAKGVMLSEHNICSGVYYGLQVANIREVGLSVLPYHHSYESVPGLLVALHNHSTLCINDNLKRVLKNLTLYQPQYIYLVPAFVEVIYRRIWANIEEQGKTKIIKAAIKTSNALRKTGVDVRRKLFAQIHNALGGKLEKIVCGGAPIRAEIGKFFEDIGIILCNGYGITECSPLVSVNQEHNNDCTTVGFPLACAEVKIADPNEDGEGEICVKGDIVMMGYYENPEATAEVFDRDGFFKTGDYGKLNSMGQLVITGRKKNIIILGNGKNIYPEEIEGYIGSVPYITDVVVYGEKDENGHEVALCAEAAINADMLKELDKEQIRAKLKSDIFKACEVLPSYKQITKVTVREKPFVKTTSNKIKRDKNGIPL